MNMTTSSSTSSTEGIVPLSEHRLSVENQSSFFKHQYRHFLLESRSGRNTDLNFVSKSGVVVSAHQAILLPHSSLLQTLVDSGDFCGYSQEAPTLLLPDEDHEVIEALVDLLYSGSAVVTGGVKEDLIRLMRELGFDFLDQLLVDPVLPSSDQDYQNGEKKTLVPQILGSKPRSNEDSGTGEKAKQIKLKHEEDTIEIEVEQETIIKKLSYVLDFLTRGKIANDHFFKQASKPVGDLLSCLKYLPGEPHFSTLPTEIKDYIFSYLCDNGTIVAAAVCLEWRDILNKRLILLKQVYIGKHCTNVYSCEEDKCFMPEQMFMAMNILKLNTQLYICSSVTNVNPHVLVDGLTSVSSFAIDNKCDCNDNENEQILTKNQIELLIETLEHKSETVDDVVLDDVDMAHLDQDKVINCLLKIKTLDLGFSSRQINVEKLIEKLSENSVESKLKNLVLGYLEYPDNLSVALANALCQVPAVFLGVDFPLTPTFIQRLIENILTRPIRIKRLAIRPKTDWRTLIDPENLRNLVSKLDEILLYGRFTSDQKEAVRALPLVNVDDGEGVITKRMI